MKWGDIGRKLGQVAPTLGRAVAGPAGGVVGEVIANRLGVDPTPVAVAGAIAAADPETMLKLYKLDVEMEQAFLADVQDARTKHTGHPMTWVLPLVLIAVWLYLIYVLVYVELPLANRDQFFFAFGSWTALTGAGVSYWLGTSRGSAAKQHTLEQRF